MEGMEMASPEAAPPVPSREPAPVGEAADEATGDEVSAGVSNVIACVNSDSTGLSGAALMTSNLMANFFGTENVYDAAAGIAGTQFTGVAISNPMTYEDGRVSADVQYFSNQSEYQLNSERWYLMQDGEYWKLDEIRFGTASTDMAQTVVGANLTQPEVGTYAIELGAESSPATEMLTFHATNAGTELHELLVFKLPEGADPMGMLDGSIPEEDAEFIGAVAPLYPGDQADLNLVNLPAGVYTLVCFFPAPDGSPHAAHGMVAQFEVTAAG